MTTRTLKIDASRPDPAALREAAERLRRGEIVAVPTETVYGLAALWKDPEAVRALARLKGRPADRPFPIQVAEPSQAAALADEVPARAKVLMRRFWPGPLTIVLPAARGRGVGVRISSHAVARGLAREIASPLAVPSANRSGEPPARDADEVARVFRDRIGLILDAGRSPIGRPSTVVRVDRSGHEVLREGVIEATDLAPLLGGLRVLFVCTGNTCRSPMAAGLFRAMLARRLGLETGELAELGWEIGSAGTAAIGGAASRTAVDVLRAEGIDLEGHRSRRLDAGQAGRAHRIIVMDAGQRIDIIDRFPGLQADVTPLDPEGIPDPIGGGEGLYRACMERIRAGLVRFLGELGIPGAPGDDAPGTGGGTA